MSQPVVFQGDLFFLQDGKFNQNWIYITDNVLRIYKERQFTIDGEDQDEPMLQIPVTAIYNVVENIERADQILNLQYSGNTFALQLKNDFQNVFMMENYDSNGLEDSQIKEILKQEMPEEYHDNLEGLVASYHNLEKALFGENVQEDEDDRDEQGIIEVEEENLADL